MIKILHILYSGLGGHGNVFFSMVEANSNKEFVFEVLFNGIEEPRTEYIEKCQAHNIKWSFIKKQPGLDPGFYKNLYTTIRSSDASILFLHGGGTALPAYLAKKTNTKIKKIIVRETQANHLKTKKEWFYLSSALRLADDIVFLSNEYSKEIRNKYPGLYKNIPVHVIPNGINLDVFQQSEKSRDARECIIGMQSRMVDIKDHSTLIKAVRILKNDSSTKFTLLLAGDGSTKASLQTLAKQLGLEDNVIFTGMLSEQELTEFLHRLDIYVHASYGETMSTAIMQAMASHLPIVASDVPGINNMIQDNVDGLLVPVEDVEKLANAILQLYTNAELAQRLAHSAHAKAVHEYSNSKMFLKYRQIFLQ